jgi:hypothetical protein
MNVYDPLRSRVRRHFTGTTPEGVTYRTWTGGHVGDAFGADTETTMVGDPPEVPELIVLGAFNGREVHLVRPDQIGAFFAAHPAAVFSFHNAAFDAAVLAKAGLADIYDRIEAGQIRCSMLLDQLVAIAAGGDGLPRNLAEVAADWTDLALDKSDPFRTRFTELKHVPWILADTGFWRYLSLDCVATFRAYAAMARVGREMMNRHLAEIDPQAIEKYGILTERLQLKARCVFDWMRLVGIQVDLERMTTLREQARAELDRLVDVIEQHAGCPVFKRHTRRSRDGHNQAGDLVRNDNGLPAKSMDVIRRLLPDLLPRGVQPETSSNGKVSLNGKFLARHRHCHPLIGAYADYVHQEKQFAFLTNTEPIVRPRYGMTRTLRSSCSSPNLQQVPANETRHCFVPRNDHVLFCADLSAVELATLGATCRQRYGFSVLADTIEAGIDPHAFTAAKLLGVSIDQLKQRPDYKAKRQAAKAVNFGFGGGLGPATLVEIARDQYGVEMSEQQARQFKETWTTEIFPEMAKYLAHDPRTTAACLVGNIRGGVTYCDGKNFPFQSLAAAIGKEILWHMWRLGYRPVAFIHDEFLVELPIAWDMDRCYHHLIEIMKTTAREFTGLPVGVEGFLSTCWTKQGRLVTDSSGRVTVFDPRQSETSDRGNSQPDPQPAGAV